MRRTGIVVVLLLVGSLLMACGGGGGGGATPEGAAKAFIEAAVKGDVARLKALTCEEDQETVEDDWSIPDGYTADISKLQFKTTESTADSAVVQVTGTMKVTYEGGSEESELDEELDMVKENGQWKQCGN